MQNDRNEKGASGREDEAVSTSREVRFVDRAGVLWRAYERKRPGQRPALVFDSANAVRLVRDYPENWYTLPSAALEALSWWV